MWQNEENSELEARFGKRLTKLLKTLEIYGESGDIKETARVLCVTQRTVENRLSTVAQEFKNAKKFLRETDKYKSVLYRKESAHSKRIGDLCKIGKTLGYKTWIGNNERSYIYSIDGREEILGGLSDFWTSPKLLGVNSQIWGFLRFIDIMWIRDQKVHYAFEIETTTSFTKTFDRSSNIPREHSAIKVVVIPRNRRRSLLLSIRSNLISHEIERGNWYLLDFQTLEDFKKSNSIGIFDFMNILERISL